MAFVNNYVSPIVSDSLSSLLPEDQSWGPEPYDVNFAFPLYLDTLESERIRLAPFIPRLHAHEYWKHTADDASMTRFCPSDFPH